MKVATVVFAILGSALAASIQNDVSDIPKFRHLTMDPIRKTLNEKPNLRIVNGEEVVPHSIPYQIYMQASNDDWSWSCGGSLITRRYALTAAHCLDGAQAVNVVLGVHNLKQASVGQINITAKSFKIHQNYDTQTAVNDIGIIELSSDVILTESIGLSSLISYRDIDDTLVGLEGRVSGWGLIDGNDRDGSDVLRQVNNTVMSNVNCNSTFGIITNKQICLSGKEGKTACNGDSGGPMIVGNNQVGIVSYGYGGCLSDYPTVYTRISQFIDWLQANSDWRPT